MAGFQDFNMNLVSPIADECEFVKQKNYKSAVGLRKVYCEMPFFQHLIIFRRH